MNIGVEIKKRSLDKGIKGNKELATLAGLSYDKTLRIINNQSNCKLVDVVSLAAALGLKLVFVDV